MDYYTNMKVEKIYGTGCQEQPQDNRDYIFRGITDFDWEFGFDLEKLLSSVTNINETSKKASLYNL